MRFPAGTFTIPPYFVADAPVMEEIPVTEVTVDAMALSVSRLIKFRTANQKL